MHWLEMTLILVMACTLFGLGCAVMADNLRWRLQGRRVTGTLVGTRQLGGMVYPVYRYLDPLGRSVEATSILGGEYLPALGPRTRLLVLLNPRRVREVRDRVAEVFCLLLIVWSLACLFTVLRTAPAVVAVVLATYLVASLLRRSSRTDSLDADPLDAVPIERCSPGRASCGGI